VKTVVFDDSEFLDAIGTYWNSQESRLLREVLVPTSQDELVRANNQDDALKPEMMKGAYAFEHHVPDKNSELINFKNADGKLDMGSIVINFFYDSSFLT